MYHCPKYLDDTARIYWKRLSPILEANNLLNDSTRDLVACICHYFSVFREAEKVLQKEGRYIRTPTTTKLHPLVTLQNQAYQNVCRGFKELGLSEKVTQGSIDDLDDLLEE